MGVDAYSIAARHMDIGDLSRTRHKILRRIFGIDPAFDGVSGEMDVILCHRQPLASRDLDLFFDQIQPCHHLRNWVLHLDPGVHFHKIEIFIFI